MDLLGGGAGGCAALARGGAIFHDLSNNMMISEL